MKKVYLSRTDDKIFGICGGVGKAYDTDSNLIRLGCIFLCLLTGIIPLVVTYIVAYFLLPEEHENLSGE